MIGLSADIQRLPPIRSLDGFMPEHLEHPHRQSTDRFLIFNNQYPRHSYAPLHGVDLDSYRNGIALLLSSAGSRYLPCETADGYASPV
jgi:hypothetical protein